MEVPRLGSAARLPPATRAAGSERSASTGGRILVHRLMRQRHLPARRAGLGTQAGPPSQAVLHDAGDAGAGRGPARGPSRAAQVASGWAFKVRLQGSSGPRRQPKFQVHRGPSASWQCLTAHCGPAAGEGGGCVWYLTSVPTSQAVGSSMADGTGIRNRQVPGGWTFVLTASTRIVRKAVPSHRALPLRRSH